MRFRSVALLALALAFAAVWVFVPVGSTASALGTCSIVAPTKVVLDRPAVEVPYRLGSDCAPAGIVRASWDLIHPSEGPVGGITFDGTGTGTWDLQDWMGPARYTVRPWAALDAANGMIAQNAPHTTVKLGSRLTATVSRAGGRLTLGASARTYSPMLGGWDAHPGVNVSLMHLAPGSSAWTSVKAAATDSNGRVSLSVVPEAGAYRLMVKETPTVWASYSSTVRGA